MVLSIDYESLIQSNTPVQTIHDETLKLLWHARLGHCSDSYLKTAHKHIDGVPKFLHQDSVLDSCPECIKNKSRLLGSMCLAPPYFVISDSPTATSCD